MKKLPPLKPLITFVAVVEQGGYARAASYMSITPSAVTHQIKQLESELGEQLFKKKGRERELTETGVTYFEEVSGLLKHLSQITHKIQGNEKQEIRLSSPGIYITKWLLPRFKAYQEKKPHLNLSFIMSNSPPKLSTLIADLFITTATQRLDGFQYVKLQSIRLVAVVNPSFYTTEKIDQKLPIIITQQSLTGKNDWEQWSQVHPIDINNHQQLNFSHNVLSIDAIIQGHGVGLVPDFIAKDAIESGQLRQLPFSPVETEINLFLVCKNGLLRQQNIRDLIYWIENSANNNGID